jgi:hypothetical protein
LSRPNFEQAEAVSLRPVFKKNYCFGAAAAAGALPTALPKNLKKSESGRNRKRVSLLLRLFS